MSAAPQLLPASPARSPRAINDDDPSARLETRFAQIARERMSGLPFVNPRLRVEAVGFARWHEQWLGILITPWAMNVLLLPASIAAWPRLAPGHIRQVDFAAGSFDFVAAVDATIGEMHSCSLFSPLLEFADHDAARQTARAALIALSELGTLDAIDPPAAIDGDASVSPVSPVSRRDFFRRWRPAA